MVPTPNLHTRRPCPGGNTVCIAAKPGERIVCPECNAKRKPIKRKILMGHMGDGLAYVLTMPGHREVWK
jgi:hypothetical protein